MDWASQYDDSTFQGRSLGIHLAWIKVLEGKVLRIDGDTTVEDRVDLVIQHIDLA